MEMVSAQDIINSRNAGILVDMDNIRNILSNKSIVMDTSVWHAFVIHSKSPMSRKEVLQKIFDFIYPSDLVPFNFKTLGNGNHYIFLAKSCAEAIEKLWLNNLNIPNCEDPSYPMKCEIILQYANVNELNMKINEILRPITYSLYRNGTVNLDCFSKNEGLHGYYPLSQPKILYHALNSLTTFNIQCIKLRNNEIRSLNSQEVLWKFTSLTQLDLRNNMIEDISAFEGLKDMKITEIYLDGNPICDKMDEYTYVSELRNIFPNLQKIDGILITRDGAPAFRRNFLCNIDGFAIVNKFMETYFTLYDKDRALLLDIYHPNALCSITNLYKTGQITSSDAKLRPYQTNCRNLLTIANLAKRHQTLIRGNECIIRKLNFLPLIEHDLYSFTTDLMFYSEDVAIVNVCGVFREVPISFLDKERHLGFARTFVLKNFNGEFLITNDMFNVYNALTSQVDKSFKVSRPIVNSQLPPAKTNRDKEKAIEAFQIITGLTKEWSAGFLEKAGYNLSGCVKSFMDMYKVDQIPQKAFNQ